MDIFFHAASGALLASALGEKRTPQLVLAGIVASLPDLVWGGSVVVHRAIVPYPIAHSFLLAGIVTVLLLAMNWRIAFGPLLHVLIDLPLHKHSNLYHVLHVDGINWYQGYALAISAALWAVLIVLAVVLFERRRRARTRRGTGKKVLRHVRAPPRARSCEDVTAAAAPPRRR